MSTVENIQARPVNLAPTTLNTPASGQSASLLPEPSCAPFTPDDALGMLLMSAERMAQSSMQLTESRIASARKEIQEQLSELLKQLQKELAAAKKKDDGGWFGKLVGSVLDFASKALGTLVDQATDVVTVQVDLLTAAVKSFEDSGAFRRALQDGAVAFVQNGKTADDVAGFSRGVAQFSLDCAEILAELQLELTRAAVTGEDPLQCVEASLLEAYDSLEQNVLDNPHFWEVMSVAAKGATLASGGSLAPLAVVLIVLSEVDARTNLIERAVGEDAAPFVRAGLQLATAALTLGPSSSNDAIVDLMSKATSLIVGGGTAINGVRAMVAADEAADALERAADHQQTLNGIQRLERLVSGLIDSLQSESEARTRSVDIGHDLVRTRAATQLAAVLPA